MGKKHTKQENLFDDIPTNESKNYRCWTWRAGLVIKNTGYFCRGPGFNS